MMCKVPQQPNCVITTQHCAQTQTLTEASSSFVRHIKHRCCGFNGRWVDGGGRCSSPVSQTPVCWSRCLSFPQRSSRWLQIFKILLQRKKGLTPSKRCVLTGWTDRLSLVKHEDGQSSRPGAAFVLLQEPTKLVDGGAESVRLVASSSGELQAGTDWGQRD